MMHPGMHLKAASTGVEWRVRGLCYFRMVAWFGGEGRSSDKQYLSLP